MARASLPFPQNNVSSDERQPPASSPWWLKLQPLPQFPSGEAESPWPTCNFIAGKKHAILKSGSNQGGALHKRKTGLLLVHLPNV